MDDLTGLAKADPGRLGYASTGMGSSYHLAMEHFKQATGIELTQSTYHGSQNMVDAVQEGQVTVLLDSNPSVAEALNSGKLRALAVAGPGRPATS